MKPKVVKVPFFNNKITNGEIIKHEMTLSKNIEKKLKKTTLW
jgi:hypothetical protein